MDTVTLTIDGRQVSVEKGKTVLQAAIESGCVACKACRPDEETASLSAG